MILHDIYDSQHPSWGGDRSLIDIQLSRCTIDSHILRPELNALNGQS